MLLTRQQIYRSLTDVLRGDARLAVIHSSLIHLGAGRDIRWEIMAALTRLVKEGRTLALPAFTFSFCSGTPFDAARSKSETGILADWLLQMEGARRTLHPIYSFAIAGPMAAELAECVNSTTFGTDSIFARFEDVNARIVMLGCGWESCTQFHRYEEEAQVPYRYFKTFQAPAAGRLEGRTLEARMYVRDLEIGAVNDFTPVIEHLRTAGSICEASLGTGRIEAADCRSLAFSCRTLLARNRFALVRGGNAVAHQIGQRQRREKQQPMRLALLSHANVDHLRTATQEVANAHFGDQRVEIFTAPYGQAAQQLLESDSALSRFQPHLTVFADRLEDIIGRSTINDVRDLPEVDRAVDGYMDLVAHAAKKTDGWVLVTSAALMPGTQTGTADTLETFGGLALTARVNARFAERLRQLPQARLIDISALAGRGAEAITDPRLWYLGRFLYSAEFSRRLARKITGLMMAATGRACRLIVIDLDNTLWGGVLGEDGPGGLQLGGDYPGNAYRDFQIALKHLNERGIALALCSKNDEAHALAAIRDLPAMVLRPDDFSAWRINWQPKWQNIDEIAAELDLGLQSVLFVDDNPVEREQMRRFRPEVAVLDLPDDPALFLATLIDSPHLECLTVTPEDRKRASAYRSRRQVQTHRANFDSVEEFLSSLETRLHIFPLAPGNLARATQLIAKTNQFNATTKRYSSTELERLQKDGVSILILGVEDRFSELENVGVLIIRWECTGTAEIDNILMSCRVLGRGVEAGVLAWLREECLRRDIRRIVGRIVPSERNTPVRNLYMENGFSAGGQSGEWFCELSAGPRVRPHWVEIIDHHTPEGSRVNA